MTSENMTQSSHHPAPPHRGIRRARSSGIALVLVLSCLVLIVILIVGLLTRASSERATSNAYAATTSARQLAEMAINLVQGQITTATTQGGNVTWASQPGMIRTFGDATNTATGRADLLLAYKLYSAENLIQNQITITDGSLAEDLPPDDWSTSGGIWTDLNEPIVLKIDDNDQKIYPILDPGAGPDNLAVEGFATNGSLQEKLPVRWLYVLKDGSLKPGVASGTDVTVSGATATNPIVGRIAFWADDDTSKVNINTAGAGKAEATNTVAPTLNSGENGAPELFWDVPRFVTDFDRNLLANAQPAKNEFTRYPGHPAWTSLSTVFPALSMKQVLENRYLPRYEWGGTKGGTQRPDAAVSLVNPGRRLFATVDEFIYDPARAPIDFQPYTPADLQKLRFFLTANSRAPETNLFNLPKIACWPIADASLGDTYRTAYDRLIAFASSINGRGGSTNAAEPYHFQRRDAYSTTADFTITRNSELYTYLQELTRRNIPGFGGSFVGKYTVPERDQILTSITDYIRTTNLFDDNLDQGKQFTKGTKTATRFFHQTAGHGMVMPLRHPSNGTQGFGRFYTVSEFAIHFIATAESGGFREGPLLLPAAPPATLSPQEQATFQLNNDARLISNVVGTPFANRTLGSIPLQGEPYKDVGAVGGNPDWVNNGKFDFIDMNANGICDRTPFDDTHFTDTPLPTNHNGQWDPGEPYAGSVVPHAVPPPNPEIHEPFHDWGADFQTVADSSWFTPVGKSNLLNRRNGKFDALPMPPGQEIGGTSRRIEAMIHLEFFCPALGNRSIVPDMEVEIEGLSTLSVNGVSLGFPSIGLNKIRANAGTVWSGAQSIGGNPGIRFGLMPNDIHNADLTQKGRFLKRSPARGALTADAGFDPDPNSPSYNSYPFLSIPITVTSSTGLMNFEGGPVTIKIYGNSTDGPPAARDLIQTINLTVPSGTFPVPNIVSTGTDEFVQPGDSTVFGAPTNRSYWWTFSRDGATPRLLNSEEGTVRVLRYLQNPQYWNTQTPAGSNAYFNQGRLGTFSLTSQLMTFNAPGDPYKTPASISPTAAALFRGGPVRAMGLAGLLKNVNLGWPQGAFSIVNFPPQDPTMTRGGTLVAPKGFDVVRSLLPRHGDYRLIAGRENVPATEFVRHPDWDDTSKMFACNLWEYAPLVYLPTFPTDPGTPVGSAAQLKAHPDIRLVEGVTYGPSVFGGVMVPDIIPNYVQTAASAVNPSETGDFDNGIVFHVDGAYINKPDEGNASYTLTGDLGPNSRIIPYFDFASITNAQGSVLFSPNRIMPSPGMFGSLSTGIQRSNPWQTLLLRPQSDHPNAISPPDHLLLDLFWMPTVEPYAISDPFATAGKVNMNSQLMPFTWIERTTGLRAVLKGERMTVVPNSESQNYKTAVISPTTGGIAPKGGTPKTYRVPLAIDETLENFHELFRDGDIFRSSTEICTLPMVPEGSTLSAVRAGYWNNKRLTGDESRERIYTTLLPRLTTKSNSFTVHVRTQVLQKVPNTDPGKWVEDRDVVKGEYRGSTSIERYLDPNDESIPNYATDVQAMTNQPLDRFYKWRQLQTVDFNY